jgi:hypothetical protein
MTGTIKSFTDRKEVVVAFRIKFYMLDIKGKEVHNTCKLFYVKLLVYVLC